MAYIEFKNTYIKEHYSVCGPKEAKSKIKLFDKEVDYYFGTKSFEQAEIKMQRHVYNSLLEKGKYSDKKIDLFIAGDLTNQIGISNYSASFYNTAFLGIYSACSSFCEGLILASNFISSKTMKNIIVLTSSHTNTAERQFRYPIEYGAIKPAFSTTTITSSIGCVVTNKKTKIKIIAAEIGRVVNKEIKDANNMGAVMAPAAADTIYNYLKNSNKCLEDFDLILTGDLGYYGLGILKDYYKKEYNEELKSILDAGSEIFYEDQDMSAGGSGPACLPFVFFNKIILNKKYKKILLVGTGSLHNSTLTCQKMPLVAVSHALEVNII